MTITPEAPSMDGTPGTGKLIVHLPSDIGVAGRETSIDLATPANSMVEKKTSRTESCGTCVSNVHRVRAELHRRGAHAA